MGIKKIDENKYEVRFSKRHPINRQSLSVRRIVPSLAEARRVLMQLPIVWEEMHNQKLSGTTKYKIILDDFFTDLENRVSNNELSILTAQNYKLCLVKHTEELWKNRPIESITTDEIKQLIRVKLQDTSLATQKNILKYLRGIFNFAFEKGAINRSPVPKMQFRNVDKIKGVLNEQQIKIFLEKALQAKHEWYPIWVTAIYTGMRNGELYALTWDHIDLENRKIYIKRTWNHKAGFKELTKSGEDRVAEIAPQLLTVLKEQKLKSYADESVFVLPRIEAWDKGMQAEVLKYFLVGVGLPAIRFHDLRASFATACLGRGIAPAKVMSMCGWRDLKTMMIYMRKAGINIKGMTDELSFHDAIEKSGEVFNFNNLRKMEV